jgi:hypothetical protein
MTERKPFNPFDTQPIEPPAVSTPVVLYVLGFAVFTVLIVSLICGW